MTAESGALSETTEGVIKVNGAELFYQLRGSGPAMICPCNCSSGRTSWGS